MERKEFIELYINASDEVKQQIKEIRDSEASTTILSQPEHPESHF